jgi:hypothetical protein
MKVLQLLPIALHFVVVSCRGPGGRGGDDYCDASPYSALSPLSTYSQIQSYCSQHYPVTDVCEVTSTAV